MFNSFSIQDIHVNITFSSPTLRSLGAFRSKLPLCTCESVHECGQGPVEHLEEGVPAGVLVRSTENRVLQDVWDPCAVHGSRSELDTETQEQV